MKIKEKTAESLLLIGENNTYPLEVRMVKELGERIGYGNMMDIASSLWAIDLEDVYNINSGAFIPAGSFQMKKVELRRTEKERIFKKKLIRKIIKNL